MFQIGSLVRLKSSGPTMTVESCRKHETNPDLDQYSCVWFTQDHVTLHRESFSGAALSAVAVHR
ncbi:YodC family protein [Photobacterium damselae]|uniref:DUF2158 domain-containing protein n=1 Tax=Photobacterium damselae TaxID=38293 RepID=A0ABD6WZA5_PHODM|nr:DUF2158 domain-containing protein [Photobacterium damselae]OBU38823.1 hypothetical protein AYY27_11705 [Photobacterium damselae]PSU15085.1 DUF2158 domain-containing protein [Photobacterium damselae]